MPPTHLRKHWTSRVAQTRRQFLHTSLATMVASSLSGCGWTLAEVKTTPNTQISSDTLYIYTWAGYTDQDLLDRFQKETGLKVVADVFDSNESMLARVQAGGAGAYSVIYPSEYMVQKMAQFIGLVILGGWGLSLVFSFLAAIAAKAQQSAAIMAILGFPLIIPQLLMLMQVSNSFFSKSNPEILTTVLLLATIDLFVIILAIILFPFLWKD